mmetsp:Transcript_394/g.616  ORF Transcript_394/g.616 Transcript_394/m.616 type:complete len:112 (-) Transcript_394:336-671(-)
MGGSNVSKYTSNINQFLTFCFAPVCIFSWSSKVIVIKVSHLILVLFVQSKHVLSTPPSFRCNLERLLLQVFVLFALKPHCLVLFYELVGSFNILDLESDCSLLPDQLAVSS